MGPEFCDRCKKNPAYVHVAEIVDGAPQQFSLCNACAYKDADAKAGEPVSDNNSGSSSSSSSSKLAGACILVTGGSGFLGKYVVEILKERGAVPITVSRSSGVDLRNEADTMRAFLEIQPDAVIHLAAVCGGIGANMEAPATFFTDNMLMGMNVVKAACIAKRKLIAVGTICSFPKNTPVPFKEESYWNGYPEETNAPYGIAKKALGVMMEACRKQYGLQYGFLVPANLYGPCDHFDASKSHVIPAMIRKFVDAKEAGLKEVVCWGTGKPTRSFLFAADAADAIVRAVTDLDTDLIVNLPGLEEISMAKLAVTIAKRVGFHGLIKWNPEAPDGQPRRFIDGARAKELLGWEPTTPLETGLQVTIEWYQAQAQTQVQAVSA